MNTLNKEQSVAVMSDDKKILCLAGAGTGKTFSMIERIARLVSSGVDPTSILALTFTNAAAFEMRSRFQNRCKGCTIPEFRTFHSFCYSLMAVDKEVRRKLGYTQMPSLATDSNKKQIEKLAGMQIGVHLSQRKMSGDEPLTEADKYNLRLIEKARARIMKSHNVITFQLLLSKVCELFINKDPVVQKYIDRFKYIFVDEFQDTDPLQWKFVQTFEDASIFIVGDAQQAIYAFRGADSSIIKELACDKSWKVIRLTQNYRSSENICKFANAFTAKYADASYRVAICSTSDGPDVDTIMVPRRIMDTVKYSKTSAVSEYILNELKTYLDTFPKDCAVLCRTNAEVQSIQTFLDTHNMPYVTAKRNIFGVHVLKSVLDDDYCLNWLSTMLTADNYAEYIRLKTIKEEEDDTFTLNDFYVKFSKVGAVVQGMDMVNTVRSICREHRPIKDRYHDILNIIGCPGLDVDISKCTKLSEFLQTMIDGLECPDSLTSEIYVGTIHSVKGLEYESVVVVGAGGPRFQLNDEQNNNLFYVAITRAKKNLRLYVAGQEDRYEK